MMLSKRMGIGLIAAAATVGFAGAAFGGATHEYQVRFEPLWNPTDHPTNYPPSAHFSPLIGASHSAGYDIWEPGTVASLGLERVAELGSTTVLTNEINGAISGGTAQERITGSAPFPPFEVLSTTFTVSSAYPLVTVITMVAPSHDWFVGIDSFDVRDETGHYRSEIVFDLPVWDAGTEPGNNFSTSGNVVEGGVVHLLPNVGAIFGGTTPIARMTLIRLTPLTGDLNDDGVVDTADLGLLIGVFGTNSPVADINEDSIVDTADLGLLIANFGASDS